MSKPLRVLVVEDSEVDALVLVTLLRREGYTVTSRRVADAETMRLALTDAAWDLVLSDHEMPGFDAEGALQLLQATGQDLPFLIVSGGIGEEVAVRLMKAGAHDFLIKGHLGRLGAAVDRELREAGHRAAGRAAEASLRESEQQFRLLWQNSPDGILMVDDAGRIGFSNPAVTQLFGRTTDELRGAGLDSLFPAASGGEIAFHRLCREASGQPGLLELTGLHKSGTEVNVEIGCSELQVQGQLWHVAFIRDLTLRRRAERALQEREQEFQFARQIQRRLFPKSAPPLPGFDLAGASFPAAEASGDYFDFLPMLAGGWGLAVGDVSGHGMGPALIMAETRAYLRIVALNRRQPHEVLARANTVLADDLAEGFQFVTLFLARLDPGLRQMTYCNAGHPAALLIGPDGQVKTTLAERSTALGMLPESTYMDAGPIRLASGDLLVVLTDGIEEAVTRDGTRFGLERAVATVRAHQHRSARDIVEALHRAVVDFLDGESQADDITALVMKVG